LATKNAEIQNAKEKIRVNTKNMVRCTSVCLIVALKDLSCLCCFTEDIEEETPYSRPLFAKCWNAKPG
jgi:hypothetical protein